MTTRVQLQKKKKVFSAHEPEEAWCQDELFGC
jgi:hypothetical protein